jgi:hypothetical protein
MELGMLDDAMDAKMGREMIRGSVQSSIFLDDQGGIRRRPRKALVR